jgi:alpha-beta hydrolase superfamily lysophospholipase
MTVKQGSIPSRIAMRAQPGRGEQLIRWWQATASPRATVVLVHGYGEHSGRYEHVGGALAEAGFAAWTTDLRGHGRTSGERASVARIADLADDVGVVLEEARAANAHLRVFVLGHSMGGLVATCVALDPPFALRGLILSGPAVGDPAGLDMALGMDPFPELSISSDGLSRDPAVVSDYDTDPLNYRGAFRRETLQALADGARAVRARAAEIKLPLLVLHGGEDPIVPALGSQELFAAVSSTDKQIEIYPGLRHEILNEPEGAEIARAIAAWIAARA